MGSNAGLPPLVGAMRDPAFYPHATTDIRLIETHISWVLLTGEYAYKIKKPVDFGFLDFSTLASRRHFCEQELKLNRRLAAEIYLEVRPISRTRNGYCFGDREICEYVLKMRQFDQEDLLDHRLAAGHFNPAWMDALACDIAALHLGEASAGADPACGDPERLHEHINANLTTAARHIGAAIDRNTLASLRDFHVRTLTQQEPLLRQRRQGGFIRDCHGDLHLRNITLLHHRPIAFDCIEFNDAYRMIDIMNDAAFLIMDCDARGRPDLGMRFLSRYLEQTGDYAGLALLPLFLCYRAGVRGKVACLLGEEQPPDKAEVQWKEARLYFGLASRYTRLADPVLYAIGGLSGSGKSYLALQGLAHTRAVIIRSDATRKRIAADRSPAELYNDTMHHDTYRTMLNAAKTALAAGFSVILDATFLDADRREETRHTAEEQTVPLRFYWLDVPEETLRRRIASRQQQGTDVSDADLAVLERQLSGYRRPQETDIHFLRDSSQWPESATGE